MLWGRISLELCVRDSDPWGGDSRESCIAFLGSEAPFYEVGRERSEPGNP